MAYPLTPAAAAPEPPPTPVDYPVASAHLTVGVFNIERFGYDPDQGHHRLRPALDFLLEHTPTPPDVLAFPEATHGLADQQRAIRRHLVHYLSPYLSHGWYEPLFATQTVAGRRNHLHLLLVNTAVVKPLGWADPAAPLDPGCRHYGWAECLIHGHTVRICCEHWSGGEGREVFERCANRVSTMGGAERKSLLLGDFNADSGWEGELHSVRQLNWYRQCVDQHNVPKLLQKGWFNPDGVDPETNEPGWEVPWEKSGRRGWWEIDTRQLDRLRTVFGYTDMGEEWGDPTPTTNPAIGSGLRIDRIFRSRGFPGEVVSYRVAQPPRKLSDHAYVYGRYRMPVR